MNAKLTTDNATYKLNECHRHDAMRAAEHHRIARIAREYAHEDDEQHSRRAALVHLLRSLFSSGHHNGQPRRQHQTLRRVLHMGGVGLALALMLMAAAPSYAQEGADPTAMIDTSATEAYSPALVDYRVAIYYQEQGDHNQAVEKFSSAIAVLPDFAYAFSARGDSYTALGDYASAIADYSITLSYYPDFISVLYMRGCAYVAAGDTLRAMADFQNAMTQMPGYAEPFLGAADLYYAMGDMATALNFYQAYVERAGGASNTLVLARIVELQAVV
ncbi:MAG: tetratricopeptide repeat protein [Anaerolineae bacterium]|nr:tetratricopeptide repeat protein [Anaerolineae bacterium]NUQ05592.1 tetratricopeptide repeat protein [Anaerolineae bacterium]